MPPGSSSSGGFRESVKRRARGVKKWFKPVPGAGASTSTANLKTGADPWTGLKVALELVKESSDVFPPLKSAVAGFLSVVDIFEKAAQNRKDYEELALHLESMVTEFREHPEERTSSGMSKALRDMLSALDKDLAHVVEQRKRTGFRSHLEARQDVGDLQECYRRVDILCRELQNKAVLKTWSIVEEQQARARLKDLNAALQAMYDSSLADVVGRRTCTYGTREAILAEMRTWANDPEGPKVYWLNGMAGTGKTTLAYSFCAEMKLAGRLGASFFCSRVDQGSRDVSRIVPTIAYQLARISPSYREVLIRQIGEDEDIGMRKTETQFEKLIRDPLREVQASMPEGIVVTIDALDECDRRDGARDVLDALLLLAQDLPIRFFVTCRPEPGLFDVLQAESGHRRAAFTLHDVEASLVQADIETYLKDELGALSLSPGKLGQLVQQAGTLFIYAATAVRYIHPKDRLVESSQRLEQLLSIVSTTKSNKHRDIDDLYRAVLGAPFSNNHLEPKEHENIRFVLDTTICAKEPMSAAAMAELLGLRREEVVYALQYLRSVLHVSQGANLISTLHASFSDFMLDHERSENLWCDAAKHHHHLSLCCFSTMQRLLRFNICELASSFDIDEDIPELMDRIEKAIPPQLYYACQFWPDHSVFVEAVDDVCSALEEFLSNRLLFWMEVLNLKRCINVGVRGLYRAQTWTQGSRCPVNTQQLIRDAAGFVTMFSSNPISRSTPHIYISALPFWPEQRPISKHYSQKTKGLPKATGTGMRVREAAPLAICVSTSSVSSVAYSYDGARIASGYWDNMIRIWDAHTGKKIGEPLEGHTGPVYSVAYSPNSARIVSGSGDDTVRVWDAHTGMMVGEPLEGHTGPVHSVAYSSDSAHIISGSDDSTIRVWDVSTGKTIGEPLKGHTGPVRSVAYSSDSAHIVSGSDDSTIRIWDAQTGKMVGKPLEGHTGPVHSVAYSSDSTRIVSGSDDNTIRIWDVSTGNMIGEPLKGHTGPVRSITYSADGARVVSGSSDNTVRMWDAHTGKMIGGALESHTGCVYSVAYTPDNACIVSGSGDNTIRVWDAHTGNMIGELPEGHTDTVTSVAYSSDSARIVSGSWDYTIRVWDAHTGKMVGEPLEGHTGPVSSVAYSPDSARIVSGSLDKTIRIWDAHTGKMIGDPLKGHAYAVSSVAFSSDSARIVSGSDDNTIRIWDAQTGAAIGSPLEGHAEAVYSVAFSSDDARIVSGSRDETIRIWDAQTGAAIGSPLEGHTGAVYSVAYSSDMARIVSGSNDSTIRVWDANTGLMIGEPLEGFAGAVNSVAYSPDNTSIVSGSWDNTIQIWDAHTGQMIDEALEGHTGEVWSVAYSPDGARIVSGSDDSTIRITVSGHTSNSLCNTWVLNQDGFMRAKCSELVMWVPSDVRAVLLRPQNAAVISTEGWVKVNFTDAYLGDSWTRCYQCT